MSEGGPVSSDARKAELAAGLATIRERIESACTAAGRSSAEVRLVVVTKYFPVSDVQVLADLGVSDIGENRDQEAAAKVAELPASVRAAVQVHFVGQVQTNKAASVAGYADVVHSVDRIKLVNALDRAAQRHQRILPVLLQVSLDGQAGRGGIDPSQLDELADRVEAAAGLSLRGLMAVAPLGEDPEAAFSRLAGIADRLRRAHPAAEWVSAGMSADLETAIAHGATHLRVGSAILGSRPPLG